MTTTDNIILIGMPGAGKSTLGVVLAKILGYDFIDADIVIQNQKEKTLQEIIEERGPEGFIEVENEVLCGIEPQRTIVSTGGSAVYSDEAMKHFAEIGRIVFLQISYGQLVDRLGSLRERGVVMKNGMGISLGELFDERQPLYEQYAQITVDVNDLSIMDAAQKVLKAL